MLGADVFLLSMSVFNARAGATGHYTHPVSAGLAIKWRVRNRQSISSQHKIHARYAFQGYLKPLQL